MSYPLRTGFLAAALFAAAAITAPTGAGAAEIDWNAQFDACSTAGQAQRINACRRKVMHQQRIENAYASGGEIVVIVDMNDDNDAADVTAAKDALNAALDQCMSAGQAQRIQTCRSDAMRAFHQHSFN